jgi:DnaJ family protein C protein 19
VAAAALGGRFLIVAWPIIQARFLAPRARKFYYGGFDKVMTKREAALILGIR